MKNRNFRLLWFGELISQLGDKFYAIALSWWILQRTNSTVAMGFFLFACTVPGIVLGLFTGALTDRLNRKRLMVVTDIIRGSLVMIMACLSYLKTLAVWQVFLAGIALSAVSAFFEPACQAILPELVRKEELKRANSLSQLVSGACQTMGPLLGALIVSLLGTAPVFLANSISFYIAAGFTLLIGYKKDPATEVTSSHGILKDIKEGLSFIRGRRNMTAILFVIGIAHFFVGSLTVTMPFLANSLSGKGVSNLGLLQTLLGVGLLAGAAVSGLRAKYSVSERTLFLLMIGLGTCFIGIGAAQYFHIDNRYVYLLILFMIGAIIANAGIFWQLLLQLNTPVAMTGRVFGISTLIGNTSLPIAYGMVGILLGVSSITTVMFGSGICLVLLGALLIPLFANVNSVERASE